MKDLGDIPFMPSSAGEVAAMVDLARQIQFESMVELGAGTGQVLTAFRKEFGGWAGKTFTGIELNPTRAGFLRALPEALEHYGSEITILEGSMFDFDFSEYDLFVTFAMDCYMPRIAAKIRKERGRKKTHLISNWFRVTNRTPLMSLNKVHLYKL